MSLFLRGTDCKTSMKKPLSSQWGGMRERLVVRNRGTKGKKGQKMREARGAET